MYLHVSYCKRLKLGVKGDQVIQPLEFPGDPVVKTLPANAGDASSISDPLGVPHSTRQVAVVVVTVMSDSATLWTVACQAPLSMGFSSHEYWSG